MHRSELKYILSASIPAVGETILYTVISMFDIMLIGKFEGKSAVSAAGISNEMLYAFCNLLIISGICTAITSLTSRNIGAKKQQTAELYALLGVFMGVSIAFLVSLIFFFGSQYILIAAGIRQSNLPSSIAYLKLCSIGSFFYMLYSLLSSVLRGYGNTYTPFLISCISVLLNLILDILLILGKLGFPCYGIIGASLAKLISQFTAFCLIFIYILFKSKIKLKLKYLFYFEKRNFQEFFSLFLPSSFEEAAISISKLLSNLLILHSGTTAYAANQIANTIESISFMPGTGFSVAATTLVGLKVGEKNYKKAKNYANICTFFGIVIMLCCSIAFFTLPEFLMHFFVKETEKEVLFLGSHCLKIGSLEQPFLAIAIILTGALKGAGDAKTPLFISIFTGWCFRLPLIFLFIYMLHLSITYVWWITTFQWLLDAVLTYVFFNKKLHSK